MTLCLLDSEGKDYVLFSSESLHPNTMPSTNYFFKSNWFLDHICKVCWGPELINVFWGGLEGTVTYRVGSVFQSSWQTCIQSLQWKSVWNECAQYLADVTPLPRTTVIDGSDFKQILGVGGQVVQLQTLLRYVPNLSTELCPHIVWRGTNDFIEFHLKRVHVFCRACPVNLWRNEHVGVVLVHTFQLSFPQRFVSLTICGWSLSWPHLL